MFDVFEKLGYFLYVPKVAFFYRLLTFMGLASYEPTMFVVAFVVDVIGIISAYL